METQMYEQPRGRKQLNETEKAMILQYRIQNYSLAQIARFMRRSTTTIKRVVYGW